MQVAGADDLHRLAVHSCLCSPTRDRLKLPGRGVSQAFFLGTADDALSNRVLGLALQRRRQGKEFFLIARPERDHVGDAKTSFRQRAGLVANKEDRLHIPGPLKGGAVADEQAIRSGNGRGDGDDQRHSQAQSVRAGNDHDGDASRQCELERLAEEQPEGQRGAADREGDHRQPESRSVGQVLCPGTRLLGLAHQVDHLGQIGLIAGLLHLRW